VEVLESFDGTIKDATIELLQSGGRVENIEYICEDQPKLELNKEYVMFNAKNLENPTYYLVGGGAQSLYTFYYNDTGVVRLEGAFMIYLDEFYGLFETAKQVLSHD